MFLILTVFHPFINFLLACGAECGPDATTDHENGVMTAEETCMMSQLENDDDGLDTKYQDYTYQVHAEYDDNLSISHGELVVSYEGEVKQVLKIPQYHGVDYVNNNYYEYYFFGCFRPYAGGYYLDTNGAGFYDDDVVELYDHGLCNALLEWPGPAGYNHDDDQGGSGYGETGYYSTDGSWIGDA